MTKSEKSARCFDDPISLEVAGHMLFGAALGTDMERTLSSEGALGNLTITSIDGELYSTPRAINAWMKGGRSSFQQLFGVVYVVGFGPYIKIGYTTGESCAARVKTLETGCPEDLTIYAEIVGTQAIERQLHKRFGDCRLRREWFRLEGALDEWIASGCPYPPKSNDSRRGSG